VIIIKTIKVQLLTIVNKAYFFAAGATQKSTLLSLAIVWHKE